MHQGYIVRLFVPSFLRICQLARAGIPLNEPGGFWQEVRVDPSAYRFSSRARDRGADCQRKRLYNQGTGIGFRFIGQSNHAARVNIPKVRAAARVI